jgi:hypothetical protein
LERILSDELILETNSLFGSHRSAFLTPIRDNRLRLASRVRYYIVNTATTLSALFGGVAQPWWLFYAYLFFADGERGVQC